MRKVVFCIVKDRLLQAGLRHIAKWLIVNGLH